MEILLRRYDKINRNNLLDKGCLKSGEAVVCVPDGHPWTHRELKNPNWRIIRINASEEFINSLTEEDRESGRRRKNKLSLDKKFRKFWNDDSRQKPIINVDNVEKLLKERVA